MSRINRYSGAAALVGLVALSGLAKPAAAQSIATASVQAIANVSGNAPLTAAGVNDLTFGSVTAGTPKAPTSLASNAGRFSISGQASTPVTVVYSLPTVLNGAGASTIPITFNNTDGLLWNPYPGSHTTFNPNAAFVTSLDATGNLTIGISGTVQPPLSATTGTYTGTITMTVNY